MEKQEKLDLLTHRAKLFIVIGFAVIIMFLLITLTFSHLLSPLAMLQIRLSIIGSGVAYCSGIAFYVHYKLQKRQETPVQETKSSHRGDIIIMFNGRELHRSEAN